MQVVSLAQVGERWWIVTLEESEQGWDCKEFKPAKSNKLKSLQRAKESAKSRGLPLVEIDFSKEQIDRIAPLIQEAINRKQQRRAEKERLKPEKRQHRELQNVNKATPTPQQTPPPRQPAKPSTAQQVQLEESQHLKQQLAETQREKGELEREVNRLQQQNSDLLMQVSQLQKEVKKLRAQVAKK